LKRRRVERKPLRAKLLDGKRSDLKKIQSGKHGVGVACNSDLEKGEFVCTYPGEMISATELKTTKRKFTKEEFAFFFEFKYNEQLWYINGSKREGLGNFINHSRLAPNLKAKRELLEGSPVLYFVTSAFVSAGEELLYDYGENEFKEYWHDTT